MTTIKINEHLMRCGNPKLLICPKCRGPEFTVLTVKDKRKVVVVRLRCVACKEPADVMNGFVSAD